MSIEYIIGIVGVLVASYVYGREQWLRGYERGFKDGKGQWDA